MCGERRILHRLFTCKSQKHDGALTTHCPHLQLGYGTTLTFFTFYMSPKCFEHNEMLFPFRECLAMLYIVRDDQQKLSDDRLI